MHASVSDKEGQGEAEKVCVRVFENVKYSKRERERKANKKTSSQKVCLSV
jgi:hypothetical protein